MKLAPCDVKGTARWESAHALLISDLHLSPQSPLALRAFCHLLATQSQHFESILILGDLFEVYAGDDALQHDPFVAELASQLLAASKHCRIGLMHGNRDFLIGQDFCAAAGAQLLADPCILAAPAGDPTHDCVLLSHGDAWCTLDAPYQTKKAEIRTAQWQTQVLALPWAQRWALANGYREQSMAQRTSSAQLGDLHQSPSIYDVVPAAFAASCAQHGALRGLHGHTHAPAQHAASSQAGQRTVLGDWQFDASASHETDGRVSGSAVVCAWLGKTAQLLRYDGLALAPWASCGAPFEAQKN